MANRLTFYNVPSFLEKNCVITSTVQEVFHNFRENYLKYQKVTEKDLLTLSSLFGETCEKALEIVENNKIIYYYTHSNIAGIYQVQGSSSEVYTIFPGVNYCSCSYYKYQVSGGSQIICKHVLAATIADVINKKHSLEVSNEHLNDLLLKSVSLK